jgi:hypothetical protein
MRIALCLIAAIALPCRAAAQPQEPAPRTQCELHIWSAARFNAYSAGWLRGWGPIGSTMFGPDRNNLSQMRSTLDAAAQIDALQSLNPTEALGLPPSAVVVRHEEALDERALNQRGSRHAASAANCYYELIPTLIDYQQSGLLGRRLSVEFMLRAYGNDQRLDYQFTDVKQAQLHHFPAGDGEDVTAASAELVDVFKRDFAAYAERARNEVLWRRGLAPRPRR